ncbi:MAG: HAD family phosphatase [Dehalococcoidales bacterium]|nr:HAD family phosphatase [Dehalococcoidales bacterium]
MDEKAVIWDLDGVIVDTIPYHAQAWRQLFKEEDKPEPSKEDFGIILGLRDEDTIKKVFGEETPPPEVETLSERKEEYFRFQIASKNIEPMPGVAELLSSLRDNGFHQAVVSSGPMKNVSFLLSSLKIKELFEAVIASEDVSRGKPDPEGFLLAAGKMKINEKRCVVIEDTIPGIRAARRAGMKCVAVTGTYQRKDLAEADTVVESLAEITVKDLEALLE